MKHLKYYRLKSDGNGTKAQYPFIGVCAENIKKVFSASLRLGKQVLLVIGLTNDLLVKEPNPIITISLQNFYKDTSIINLVASKNEDVDGPIEWTHNLSSNIAKIDGEQLVFLSHYTGNVTLIAKANNCKKTHVILVTCDNEVISTSYALGSIAPLNNVDANTYTAIVNYTVIPTYTYHNGTTSIGTAINVANGIAFDINNTEQVVTRSGSFIDQYGVQVNWSVKQNAPTISHGYLTFTAIEDSTIHLQGAVKSTNHAGGDLRHIELYYSFDLNEWTLWSGYQLNILAGQTIYMYGNNPNGISYRYTSSSEMVIPHYSFIMSGKLAASGNIQSLISKDCPDSIPCDYCYYEMFAGCSSLTSAPELPATTLTVACYLYMFGGCSSLTTAPELPATTLADGCYLWMFYNCSNLTTAHELPATTLTGGCYYLMFAYCSSLTSAPELPATTLALSCYNSMFAGCASLTSAPELPATTLADGCYLEMFYGCSSLTTAPELPATKLERYCYNSMFSGCSSLTTAPELPATILAYECYSYMFYRCASLNYIKAMFTTPPSTYWTSNWVNGVASTGLFIKSKSASWNDTGYNSVPTSWAISNNNVNILSISYLFDSVNLGSCNAESTLTTIEYTIIPIYTFSDNSIYTGNYISKSLIVLVEENISYNEIIRTGSFTDEYGVTVNWEVIQSAKIKLLVSTSYLLDSVNLKSCNAETKQTLINYTIMPIYTYSDNSIINGNVINCSKEVEFEANTSIENVTRSGSFTDEYGVTVNWEVILLARPLNPLLSILTEDITDVTVDTLRYSDNGEVTGDIVWTTNLDNTTVKIEGNNLVFLKHYDGELILTATATNIEVSKTINVTCGETIESTTYLLSSVLSNDDVEANTTAANIKYIVVPTYHYQLKSIVGDAFTKSYEVTFDINDTFTDITRTGTFTDENGITVSWSVKQKVRDLYPELTILNEDTTDISIVELTANKNADVNGDIKWSINLPSSTATISENTLTFLKHYEGSVTLTATAINISVSKTINIICGETIVSTTYDVSNISNPVVSNDTTSAIIDYTITPTYHYLFKSEVGVPVNKSKEVTFDTNETGENISIGGRFNDDETNTIINWHCYQGDIIVLDGKNVTVKANESIYEYIYVTIYKLSDLGTSTPPYERNTDLPEIGAAYTSGIVQCNTNESTSIYLSSKHTFAEQGYENVYKITSEGLVECTNEMPENDAYYTVNVFNVTIDNVSILVSSDYSFSYYGYQYMYDLNDSMYDQSYPAEDGKYSTTYITVLIDSNTYITLSDKYTFTEQGYSEIYNLIDLSYNCSEDIPEDNVKYALGEYIVTSIIDGMETSLATNYRFDEQGYNDMYEVYDYLSDALSAEYPSDGIKYSTSTISVTINDQSYTLSDKYTFAELGINEEQEYNGIYKLQDITTDCANEYPIAECEYTTCIAVVTIDGEEVTLSGNINFSEQGYESIYNIDDPDNHLDCLYDMPSEGCNYSTSE